MHWASMMIIILIRWALVYCSPFNLTWIPLLLSRLLADGGTEHTVRSCTVRTSWIFVMVHLDPRQRRILRVAQLKASRLLKMKQIPTVSVNCRWPWKY
ncbi:uncharacterized protein EV420DRAFT_1581453, partial [Desarmillaria tabescens]